MTDLGDLRNSVNETARVARGNMWLLLAVGLYLGILLYGTDDMALLTGEDVAAPLMEVTVPVELMFGPGTRPVRAAAPEPAGPGWTACVTCRGTTGRASRRRRIRRSGQGRPPSCSRSTSCSSCSTGWPGNRPRRTGIRARPPGLAGGHGDGGSVSGNGSGGRARRAGFSSWSSLSWCRCPCCPCSC